MPGVNLSSFKELKNNYKNGVEKYNSIRKDTFTSEGYFQGDRESLWDSMWNYSDLYNDLNKLGIQIQQQLKACSNLGVACNYEEMINNIERLKCNCISDYHSIKNAIREFSDSELNRMTEFKIDRLD